MPTINITAEAYLLVRQQGETWAQQEGTGFRSEAKRQSDGSFNLWVSTETLHAMLSHKRQGESLSQLIERIFLSTGLIKSN